LQNNPIKEKNTAYIISTPSCFPLKAGAKIMTFFHHFQTFYKLFSKQNCKQQLNNRVEDKKNERLMVRHQKPP
ncbi:MAG: hypothetical protein LBV72_08105, partial [Tannerella sp.]|nr:hypothetical protein [Tannerella sp.]